MTKTRNLHTDLSTQIKSLPELCGVYQFLDKNEKVIYVGKAKNLKKRVSSYFSKTIKSTKTMILIKRIVNIRNIVVETELDALLLENNLIKKYQPRFNVMLKDDKSYPWLCIKNERFPRVFSTRKLIRDGSEYFGPYTSFKTVRLMMDLILDLYPVRSCSYDLSSEKVEKGSYKVCLEYHLENCLGPCESLIDEEIYNANIQSIREIFQGNFRESHKKFKRQMRVLSKNLEFEKAQRIKEKLEILEQYQSKSLIVHPKIHNLDVFSIISDSSYAYVNYLQINHGAIVRSHTLEMKKKLDENDEDLLLLAVVEIRQRFETTNTKIISSHPFDLGTGVRVKVPKQGDKKKLIDLSQRNGKYYRIERFKQIKIVDPDRHTDRIMEQMKKDLRLSVEPRHIECFDNSNIQGTNPVAACVVFKNAKPSKADYRHFNIKTVSGPDDYASMEEVILRRYKRSLEEASELPQLIVIDGGKGQLSAALKSLNLLGLRNKIATIGIAKRLEELFFEDDPIPLYLDKKSETLKVIQHARDEAHRFGLSHHRSKRSKQSLSSKLDLIPGVGPKTKVLLLKQFRSLKGIQEASVEDLQNSLGKKKGEKIYQELRKIVP